MNGPTQVYDKAGWHLDEVRRLGLPEVCTAYHLAFMIRWLAEQKALTEEFWEATGRDERSGLPPRVEDWGEVVLADSMVREEMRPFIAGYMRGGGFQNDYQEVLAADVPTIYHVEYSEANFARFAARLDQRHAEWLRNPKVWNGQLPLRGAKGCALILGNSVVRAPKATALGCLLIGLGFVAGLFWSVGKVIGWMIESIGSLVRGTVLETPVLLVILAAFGWLVWNAARKPR